MTGRPALRVVLADDSVLFRSGLAGLLTAAGVTVVAEAANVPELDAALAQHGPDVDVAVLDVRMPPTHEDEGIVAAIRLRQDHPDLGVLVLSTYAESAWVARLLAGGTHGLGYLLKDRVNDVANLVDALDRVHAGGTAVDPEVVARLVQDRAGTDSVSRRVRALTERERDVLALMAVGLSNGGIAHRLYLSPKTVEGHVASIFATLDLPPDTDANRRVRAVLTFLRSQPL